MAQSRQAAYLRRQSLLALRGLAAGSAIDVSDTGTAWRVWRLADGELSRRDEGEPELAGPGEQSVTSLLVDDDGVTIVGDDYGRVGLWQSDTLDR